MGALGVSNKSTRTVRERVEAAAKLANAHQFILTFPNGYDTDVGSNGISLSGGQKQRIAIARALIKRPSVLLLDEATSALDTTSERLVQQSIDDLQQSKLQTTLVIAHRLSTIRNADKIAVVADGRVAELGTHEELLALDKRYAELVRLQITGNDENEQNTDEESKEGGADLEHKTSTDHKERKKSSADVAVPDLEVVKATETAVNQINAKRVNRKVWGMIFRQPIWVFFGVLGSITFGAVFPVWGLVLAKVQAMFYSSSDHVRSQAAVLSSYFVIMAA
eukprot:gene51109-68420_t